LLEPKREVQIAVGKIGPPAPGPPRTVGRSLTANPCEGERVLRETHFVRPIGRRRAVPGNFPRGAAGLKLRIIVVAPSPATAPALRPQGSREERKQKQQQAEFFHGLLSAAAAPAFSLAPCKSRLISNSSRCASR